MISAKDLFQEENERARAKRIIEIFDGNVTAVVDSGKFIYRNDLCVDKFISS